MQTGRAVPPDVKMAGIITLEDVLEKLIQEDIHDEADARDGPAGSAVPEPLDLSAGLEPEPRARERGLSKVGNGPSEGSAADAKEPLLHGSPGLRPLLAPSQSQASQCRPAAQASQAGPASHSRDTRIRVLGSNARRLDPQYMAPILSLTPAPDASAASIAGPPRRASANAQGLNLGGGAPVDRARQRK